MMGGKDRTSAERDLRRLTAKSFEQYKDDASLIPIAAEVIRAGMAGGLPYDALTTDVVNGCLSATQICYGNCFAARTAFEAGYDFGTRIRNILDPDILRADLAVLPSAQGYLRNGWNSDPSWDWEQCLALAQHVVAADRHMVFITKGFRRADKQILEQFAHLKVEFRVSISAFDTPAQLAMRTDLIDSYRNAGGVAIVQLLSARFVQDELNDKQRDLVDYFLARDFPVSENSLRFDESSPVLDAIDLSQCGRVSSTGDYWSGRLFTELKVPRLTSVPSHYRGLTSGFLSRNDPDALAKLWRDPVRTHAEVMTGETYDKPQQCGVSVSSRPLPRTGKAFPQPKEPDRSTRL